MKIIQLKGVNHMSQEELKHAVQRSLDPDVDNVTTEWVDGIGYVDQDSYIEMMQNKYSNDAPTVELEPGQVEKVLDNIHHTFCEIDNAVSKFFNGVKKLCGLL